MNRLIDMLIAEKIPFAEHCPIAKYSTFRIGGTARIAVFPERAEQMTKALRCLAETGAKYAIVGKGSNLLFPDGEYKGAVVFTTGMDAIRWDGEEAVASAGAPLAAIAIRAAMMSLGGAEFAAGIPGTVGGAVLMNAGAYGGCMEQIVTWVECWNKATGRVERYERGEHGFSYRSSRYAKSADLVILEVGIRLKKQDRKIIDGLMADYRKRRVASQPLEYPNCGSVFQNPNGDYAGRLVEECELKGMQIGGAQVSEKHANFIVNRGGATAQDVIDLIDLVRQRVRERTGITLVCELRGLDFLI